MSLRGVVALLVAGTTCAWAQEALHPSVETPPAGRVPLEQAMREGVAFLVDNQNANGSFGKRTSGRDWEVTAAVPGGHQAFQSATTALCWMGLQDAADTGFGTEASRAAQVAALEWLVENGRVKRASGGQLYNIWSLAYALSAFAQALEVGDTGVDPERVRVAAREILDAIGRYQTPDGGWGYYDFRVKAAKPSWSTSFSTATMVVALAEAKHAGLEIDEDVVARALKNLRMARTPDGTYLYGLYLRYGPNWGINRPAGSSLRDPACTLARRLFDDDIDRDEIRKVEQRLIDEHRFAMAGVRRPIPHESWYQVSGYFYLYGQMYAAQLLDYLPEEERPRFADAITGFVLKTRQPDGSFWDYPLYGYHKFYGTGYALMTLADCARIRTAAGE